VKRGSICSRLATLPDRGRDHGGGLAGVLRHDALVGIEVGVPGVALVFDGILLQPDAGRPALLKDVLSVPPTARLVEGTAPATPRSWKSASAARTTAAASGGPRRWRRARARFPNRC